MLEQILRTVNNFFYRTGEEGIYNIQGNTIEVKNKYVKGQYIKIEGSILNDGVYQISEVSDGRIIVGFLKEEEFEGRIYGLAIPREIIELERKVSEFNAKQKNSIYISESVGNYSYTKATDKNGNVQSWISAFATELKPYRQLTDGKRRIKLC